LELVVLKKMESGGFFGARSPEENGIRRIFWSS